MSLNSRAGQLPLGAPTIPFWGSSNVDGFGDYVMPLEAGAPVSSADLQRFAKNDLKFSITIKGSVARQYSSVSTFQATNSAGDNCGGVTTTTFSENTSQAFDFTADFKATSPRCLSLACAKGWLVLDSVPQPDQFGLPYAQLDLPVNTSSRAQVQNAYYGECTPIPDSDDTIPISSDVGIVLNAPELRFCRNPDGGIVLSVFAQASVYFFNVATANILIHSGDISKWPQVSNGYISTIKNCGTNLRPTSGACGSLLGVKLTFDGCQTYFPYPSGGGYVSTGTAAAVYVDSITIQETSK